MGYNSRNKQQTYTLSGAVKLLYENRLYLSSLKSLLYGSWDEIKSAYERIWLLHTVILFKWNKINIFHIHELTDVLEVHAHGIICRNRYDERLVVLRCAFAAMRTDVSVIPFVSLAMVFPVQGAMTSASR